MISFVPYAMIIVTAAVLNVLKIRLLIVMAHCDIVMKVMLLQLIHESYVMKRAKYAR